MNCKTDRDRLIELNRKAKYYAQEKADERGGLVCIDDEVDYLLANGVFILPEDLRGTEDFSISTFIEAMQMYKEKDRYIKPPCKVGDIVYDICTIFDESTLKPKTIIKPRIIDFVSKVGFIIESKGLVISEKEFGKTVFLTKEEAEEKLKELGK